ncbi:hypothetical protein BASA81_004931 [Batrachochytrium salamandrivorans]|nr:hypothetical protein BASA81_004931 [Batrachochytrium salamandrivorans]
MASPSLMLLNEVESQGPGAEAALLQLKLKIARKELSPQDTKSVLEAACRLSLSRRDKSGLERNLLQLKPYQASPEFLALELLLLLVESRLAEFFAVLEQIANPMGSVHVQFVVLLERNLTEGSYFKALGARSESTSGMFAWLLEDLELTVREQVASCLEVSYSKGLSTTKAMQLLKFPTPHEFTLFTQTRQGWQVLNDQVTFGTHQTTTGLSKKSIPTDTTIKECLSMALELDQIV